MGSRARNPAARRAQGAPRRPRCRSACPPATRRPRSAPIVEVPSGRAGRGGGAGRRGGRPRRRLDRRHRRAGPGRGARVVPGRARSWPTCRPAKARATRSGSRSTSPRGDLVCFLDADVRNFSPHFVTRLLEPLLEEPDGRVREGLLPRPLHGDPDGGGRVTELLARPLLGALFPPPGRDPPAARRRVRGPPGAARGAAVRRGVGRRARLLVDIADRFGVDAIAEAGPRGARAPQPVTRRARAAGDGGAADRAAAGRRGAGRRRRAPLVPSTTRGGSRLVPVPVRERPPMITVPAYQAKFGRELSA